MKIAYVMPTLVSKGGTERIITEKANYMVEHYGYEVSIIVCDYHQDQPNEFYRSSLVRHIYLNLPFYLQFRYKYPKRLWYKWQYDKCFTERLTKTVNELDPDILIGIAHFHADKVCTLKCRAKKIVENHEIRSSILSNKTKDNPLYSKIYKLLYRSFYFRTIEHHADAVVTLTHEDQKEWYKSKRVEVIPNFSSLKILQRSSCETKRVIAVGRLRKEKGFSRLLDIWKVVSVKYPDWQLDIWGDGEHKEEICQKIKKENITNVTLKGTTNNIGAVYANSSICVITSYYEGFSLVILEAMKHGVPCIAYDCPCGPRSIIENGQCGFLIKDGDKKNYIEKLCKLIENEQLRKQFSTAAIRRSLHYDTDTIMNQWRLLFEDLIK